MNTVSRLLMCDSMTPVWVNDPLKVQDGQVD